MKVSTILDHIDNGHMALPEFQRGYVWNRDQVRGLFDSLYKRHPVGGLLVWATESKTAQHRGDGALAAGIVKLLLDGQQRMTSLYGVARGKPPKFFDGNEQAFTGLRFHLKDETFSFYQPIKMKDDPLWIDVTNLLKNGHHGMTTLIAEVGSDKAVSADLGTYVARLSKLLGILEIEFHIEEVTGQDKTLDVVVDIFNRVNSGGTKLSKGDLALAKICADWPDARETMKTKLATWQSAGYRFSLDWLLRSVNTILTGEAKFLYLHDKSAEEVQTALQKANSHIDTCLNLIAGRLGLDHDQVFFGRFAIPVMVRYLQIRNKALNEKERDKLLFWFLQAGMWGRYSSTVESFIDKDLEALEGSDGGLDKLIQQFRLWHGSMKVEPAHFIGWSLGSRFYSVLYMLTRMGEAKDWGTGLPLKSSLLGKMNKLEVHHIFPKARLYKLNHSKSSVNALANFCFLTKDTNLDISATLPEKYFEKVESEHPGALASQWIPMDKRLWKTDNYLDFLEARRALLSAELNKRMEELLHGETQWLTGQPTPPKAAVEYLRVSDDEEDTALTTANDWVVSLGLPSGNRDFEHSDSATGRQVAILDLAWPTGLQQELSAPVAILLNEPSETYVAAVKAGYRCFTNIADFRQYVEEEILLQAQAK